MVNLANLSIISVLAGKEEFFRVSAGYASLSGPTARNWKGTYARGIRQSIALEWKRRWTLQRL